MSEPAQPRELAKEDRQLVDLVDSVLVDPNLHTDLRMRLSREIRELLSETHKELYAEGRETAPTAEDAHGGHLPSLLRDVLRKSQADLRKRLHREITEMIRVARKRDQAGALGDRG